MPNHWTLLLLGICAVLLYAVVMPSMILSTIEVANSHHKVLVTVTAVHGHLAGSTTQPAGSTSSTSRRGLSMKEPRPRPQQVLNQQHTSGLTWAKFWNTALEPGECSISVYPISRVAEQHSVAGAASSHFFWAPWYVKDP